MIETTKHSTGKQVYDRRIGEMVDVQAEVGACVLLDGSQICERLMAGDPEPWGYGWPGCDYRWPNPLPEWRVTRAIACNVHVVGRKLIHGSQIGQNDRMWVRVKIEWVGDCEPSTYGGAYMLVE